MIYSYIDRCDATISSRALPSLGHGFKDHLPNCKGFLAPTFPIRECGSMVMVVQADK